MKARLNRLYELFTVPRLSIKPRLATAHSAPWPTSKRRISSIQFWAAAPRAAMTSFAQPVTSRHRVQARLLLSTQPQTQQTQAQLPELATAALRLLKTVFFVARLQTHQLPLTLQPPRMPLGHRWAT